MAHNETLCLHTLDVVFSGAAQVEPFATPVAIALRALPVYAVVLVALVCSTLQRHVMPSNVRAAAIVGGVVATVALVVLAWRAFDLMACATSAAEGLRYVVLVGGGTTSAAALLLVRQAPRIVATFFVLAGAGSVAAESVLRFLGWSAAVVFVALQNVCCLLATVALAYFPPVAPRRIAANAVANALAPRIDVLSTRRPRVDPRATQHVSNWFSGL